MPTRAIAHSALNSRSSSSFPPDHPQHLFPQSLPQTLFLLDAERVRARLEGRQPLVKLVCGCGVIQDPHGAVALDHIRPLSDPRTPDIGLHHHAARIVEGEGDRALFDHAIVLGQLLADHAEVRFDGDSRGNALGDQRQVGQASRGTDLRVKGPETKCPRIAFDRPGHLFVARPQGPHLFHHHGQVLGQVPTLVAVRQPHIHAGPPELLPPCRRLALGGLCLSASCGESHEDQGNDEGDAPATHFYGPPSLHAFSDPALPHTIPGGEGKPDLGGRQTSRSDLTGTDHETPAMIVPGCLAPHHFPTAGSIFTALPPTIVWPPRSSRLADDEEWFPEPPSGSSVPRPM